MPLSDLIHQVPRLLELMPSECLAALIATSTTLRNQIHNYHASDLISCSWPRLVKWTLADQERHGMQTMCVTCDTTVAAASVLAKASMLSRWQLQLHCTQLSAADVAEVAKGDWPFLVGLYIGCVKMTRALVQELVAANWPALTSLSSLEMPVDMGILSLFSQARWPQLAFLNLINVRLPSIQEGQAQIQRLSDFSKTLSEVVDPEQTSSSSSATSATLDWSSIITLHLTYQQIDTQMMTKLLHTGVNRVEVLVINCVQLDAAVILQLTKSECPRLRALVLCHNRLGSVAISYLAQGKWPLLKLLNLTGNELEDTALDELIKGEWPLLMDLKLTVRSSFGKVFTQWLGLSSASVQEALRQPEQDLQVEVSFSASNADMNPPLQPIRHVYPCLATLTLYPPRPWPAFSTT